MLDRVRKRAGVGANDDVFIVFGPEEDVRTAAEEIRLRFVDATLGVPKETRQALAGGYTTFERILPGPDRMYPDTDSPPTRVTEERVAAIKARLQPAPWKRFERYMSWRVPEETCNFLIRRGGAEIVDAVVAKTGVDGLTAAIEIGQRAKALKRAGIPVERLARPSGSRCSTSTPPGGFRARPSPWWRPAWRRTACRPRRLRGRGHRAGRARGVAARSWIACRSTAIVRGRTDSRDRRLRFLAGRAWSS